MKLRKDIAKSMLNDGWTQEGLVYVEKAKKFVSDKIEDYFLYEL